MYSHYLTSCCVCALSPLVHTLLEMWGGQPMTTDSETLELKRTLKTIQSINPPRREHPEGKETQFALALNAPGTQVLSPRSRDALSITRISRSGARRRPSPARTWPSPWHGPAAPYNFALPVPCKACVRRACVFKHRAYDVYHLSQNEKCKI